MTYIQLNIALTEKQNIALRSEYKQYVSRTESTKILNYNQWVRNKKLRV